MGSENGRPDERPSRHVFVGAFLLALTPITNEQYAPFLATGRVEAPPWWAHPAFADPLQPVVGVTWFDAVAYTEWLSEKTGAAWRLPTEAEWERAARGGYEGAPTAWGWCLPWGEVPQGPLEGPWPTGRGIANDYGLYDISTIVHEWCLDWYRSTELAPVRIGAHPGRVGRRASRGGSWRHRVRFSPPSARSSLPPEFRYADYGFRPLREVP